MDAKAPALPEKRKTRHGKELTLVLDLDETLVHCTVDPIVNPDHSFEVHFNGEEFQVQKSQLKIQLCRAHTPSYIIYIFIYVKVGDAVSVGQDF